MGLRCNPKILPLSASIGLEHPLTTTKEGKLEWQRLRRAAFAKKFGYSLAAHYATGGQRERILQRDNYACVKCGMTDAQHKDTWGRPITIDHKSKDRSDNRDENLQTLCLSCHGNKDLIARLRVPRVPKHKAEILAMRKAGNPMQSIADEFGFSIGAIHKWLHRWGETE